ncbi:MAG TPA: 4-oxalocrotonate tautomerase [Micavibrio sp.]
MGLCSLKYASLISIAQETPMPIVQIQLIEGRSIDQKRALVKKVTDAVCEAVNVKPEAVHIALTDMKKEDYADAGVLFCDR